MRVLLISMPVSNKLNTKIGMHSMPPMALYLLGAILKQNFHYVRIVDPVTIIMQDKSNWLQFLKDSISDIDLVAISSNTLNWPTNKYLINEIRKIDQNVKIVLGGLHPSYFYDYIIKTNDIDFILRGEGEKSLLQLVAALDENNNLDNISGLVYKDNSIIKVNELIKLTKYDMQNSPIPIYELLPNKVYPTMPIMTSRGCRFGCQFCSIPRKYDWVGFDADWVNQYIATLVKRHLSKFLLKSIYFTDDCFTADYERACSILDETLLLDIDSIIMEARASDLVHEKLLKKLNHKKIVRVAIGVESGYNEGLVKIKKGLTIELLNDVLDRAAKLNICDKIWLSFIYCFPWETLDDCIKTIDYAAAVVKKYDIKVNVNCLTLFPSQIWNERKKYNIKVNEEFYEKDILNEGFIETHPNFTYSDLNFINKYIRKYEDKDIVLRSY